MPEKTKEKKHSSEKRHTKVADSKPKNTGKAGKRHTKRHTCASVVYRLKRPPPGGRSPLG